MSVRPAKRYSFFVFLSPVGAYYAEGSAPVSILASEAHVRAARGGIGSAKAAANNCAACSLPRRPKRRAIPRCYGSTASSGAISRRSAR